MLVLIGRRSALCLTLFLSLSLLLSFDLSKAHAQAEPDCSGEYLVDETLPSGARWQLCWTHRAREGIVLNEIYFTPVDGPQRMVLYEASIAQIHVPYDDNSYRFHDVTDHGLGDNNLLEYMFSENMNRLTDADCPNGRLLSHEGKAMVCQHISRHGHAFTGSGIGRQGYVLSLFSVSVVGEYNYVPLWQFYDDGTIEPLMGATGALQRYYYDTLYGWPLHPNGEAGSAHTHNYYWKLDFDLNGTSNDDIVEEIEFVPTDDASQRQLSITPLDREAARSVNREQMRSWRVRDGAATYADGRSISYEFVPLRIGHHDEGPAYEPWTTDDFYVTRQKDCENYISHNPVNESDSCGEDVTEFVDGESLRGEDIVTWYGVTFHHIPRDEDEPYMHIHWDGFKIVPRDWTEVNPLAAGLNRPTLAETPTPISTPMINMPTSTVTSTPADIPAPTNTPTPTQPLPESARFIYVSATTGGTIGSIQFEDEDILTYDNETSRWSLYFDGSTVGLGPTDVDAFTILDDGTILLSISVATAVGALGIVDDADIIRFVPSAIGTERNGRLERYLNGSDLGLTTHLEDIKALTLLADGRLLLSTAGTVDVDGSSGLDEDLLVFTPGPLDNPTNSQWAFYFDGSDVGLGDSSYEDIWGVSVGPSGMLYLTTRGRYAISGTTLNGTPEDILRCMPSSLGEETSCLFQPFWRGGANGFDGKTIDGIHLGF